MKTSLNTEWKVLVEEHRREARVHNQWLIRQLVLLGCVLALIFATMFALFGPFVVAV